MRDAVIATSDRPVVECERLVCLRVSSSAKSQKMTFGSLEHPPIEPLNMIIFIF